MRVSLIIPAAGLGSRFLESLSGAEKKASSFRSKLFYSLGGEPVLLRTLRVFQQFPEVKETIVAVSSEMHSEVKRWSRSLKGKKVRWILGGETRAGSVLNALKKVSPRSDWVMVHDGARPLVSVESIKKVLQSAEGWDGVILARKVVPTIKRVLTGDGRIQETVDRSVLYEAETPQLVRRDVLFKAYRDNPRSLGATDEAGLLEAIGAKVRVVPHGDWNPKLTTLPDLLLAKAMTEKNIAPEVRVGIGFDTHRLVKGRKFYLGGVVVPSPKGALGHSDGDALLHAVADAMLGAIGGGDIGEWFSDRDPKFKNMRSTKIVAAVLGEAKRQGWVPYHADTNIILEAPKLYTRKQKIRASVARCLGLPVKDISIKARTREGLGPEGEGLAVTCEAVVSMKKVAL
ncbi:MAG TPA: 2-C-methyl-D-erythritol 2,4-cyclodiphosphate synthase [Candidatus Omnitrophota bacterium]|nr:2-C-methyl-D-erythritol 2,4-cyclodiphosphate synthase [Candidatus Omnitrophota bacterium]HPS37539.1 2-C-methyl-D-erythritol 2,4-cyclodiphosphate synthase [Candidatus Omnitrophota bacterium]